MSTNIICEERQELEVYRGDQLDIPFEIKNEDGTAYDLTGATVYFTGKKSIHDTSYLFDVLCVITNAIQGECTASLTETDTATVVKRGEGGICELEIRKGSEIRTVEQYDLIIKQDVRNQ